VHLHNLDQTKKEKEVNDNCSNKFLDGAAARTVRKTMAALAVLVFSGVAYAQERPQGKKEDINFSAIPSPTTPDKITPPVGNSAFLLGHGVGTQGYVCLPDGFRGASWTVNGARPEATLFTHVSEKQCRSSLTSSARS
jgi:hypothetical protein